MLTQVKTAFKGHEPNRGGYGSKFKFGARKDGVLLELEADWAPRCNTPSVLITKIQNGEVTVQYFRYGEPDGESEIYTVEELCDSLAEQASEG